MVRLSIIIPAVGTQQQLEDTLVSVLSHRPRGCEVIVVYPGRYDDPYELAEEVRFLEVTWQPSPVRFANLGLQASRAPLVHFLSPGIEAVEGWTDAPMRRFKQEPSIAAISPLIVSARNPLKIVAAGVAYRMGGGRRLLGRGKSIDPVRPFEFQVDGPTLSAGFFRKSALVRAGGFDLSVGEGLADVDLAMALRGINCRSVLEPDCRLATTLDLEDVPASGLRQGLFAERLFWRHASQVGWFRALCLHALETGADGLGTLVRPSRAARMAGRLVGMWEAALRRPLQNALSQDGELGPPVAPLSRRSAIDHAPLRRVG